MSQPYIEIPYWTLWDDMQVLLCQFLEVDELPVEKLDIDGSVLRVYTMDIAPYLKQLHSEMASGHLEWDERGPEHVADLAVTLQQGDFIPPIIIDHNGHWMDGRHRMFAAEQVGVARLPGMYYEEWKKSLKRKPRMPASHERRAA